MSYQCIVSETLTLDNEKETHGCSPPWLSSKRKMNPTRVGKRGISQTLNELLTGMCELEWQIRIPWDLAPEQICIYLTILSHRSSASAQGSILKTGGRRELRVISLKAHRAPFCKKANPWKVERRTGKQGKSSPRPNAFSWKELGAGKRNWDKSS